VIGDSGDDKATSYMILDLEKASCECMLQIFEEDTADALISSARVSFSEMFCRE
jgi:hypothetical protein